jgi:hypothetical protein
MVANTKRNGSLIVEYMFKKPELTPFLEIRKYLWKVVNENKKKDEPTFKGLIYLLFKKVKSRLQK